jgi:hypothetical protein
LEAKINEDRFWNETGRWRVSLVRSGLTHSRVLPLAKKHRGGQPRMGPVATRIEKEPCLDSLP